MSSYKILTLSGSDDALNPYRSMIYSDFLKSLRFGNEWYGLIDSDSYYLAYGKVLTHLLYQPGSKVMLAVLTDEPDTCLGWSLSNDKKFHYCFVKSDQRCKGIGRSLMPKTFDQVTHLTRIGQAIRKSKFSDIVFNPF